MVGDARDGGGRGLVDVDLVDGATERGIRGGIGSTDRMVEDEGAGCASAVWSDEHDIEQ